MLPMNQNDTANAARDVALPIVLVDLDDTLFQTERKCVGTPKDRLSLASLSSNGSHSYMTPKQAALVSWLAATAELVPVTARGTEAFSRVTLPFRHGAILANGAVILSPDGSADPEWDAIVRPALERVAGTLATLEADCMARAKAVGVSVRGWVVEESGMGTYFVLKENDGDGTRLPEIAPEMPGPGWVRHHNGNNIAFIPPAISKRAATEFLLSRKLAENPDRPVIGFGDSVTDLSYLGICDWWGAPGRSQITDLVAARG
jgi:hypothetical protein